MTEQEIKSAISYVKKLMKKKAYAQADKAIKLLPDGPTKDELTRINTEARKAAKAAKAEKQAEAKVAKKPDKAPASAVKVGKKMADPSAILDAYDNLLTVLVETEAEQRVLGKPHRIYFVHRKRAEVMRLNFVKSMR